MSRTYRKDKNDRRYKEGRGDKFSRFTCRCEYCTGSRRIELKEKIADRELTSVMLPEEWQNLDAYWDRQWALDEISDNYYRNVA